MPQRTRVNVRDNLGRFRQHATVTLTKLIKDVADTTDKKLKNDIAKKLEKTYKDNVQASYTPRASSVEFSYIHTGTFLDSIHAEINEDRVEIVIDEKIYDNGKTTLDVYGYLTKGTTPSPDAKPYSYKSKDGALKKYAKNYPTPIHYFEEHTREEMRGYLDLLSAELERKNHKSNKRRR